MTTGGGVAVTRTAESVDPAELTRVADLVDRRRGGVLSSGMEYPGRYSRWHMAYVNPPVEITTRGRYVTARALNDRGLVILPAIADAMRKAGHEQPVMQQPLQRRLALDQIARFGPGQEFGGEHEENKSRVATLGEARDLPAGAA